MHLSGISSLLGAINFFFIFYFILRLISINIASYIYIFNKYIFKKFTLYLKANNCTKCNVEEGSKGPFNTDKKDLLGFSKLRDGSHALCKKQRLSKLSEGRQKPTSIWGLRADGQDLKALY